MPPMRAASTNGAACFSVAKEDAHHTRRLRPGQDGDHGKITLPMPGPNSAIAISASTKRGMRLEEFGHAHQHAHPPSRRSIARQAAPTRHADQQAERRPSDDDRRPATDARAEHQLRPDVAAEIVGAHRMAVADSGGSSASAPPDDTDRARRSAARVSGHDHHQRADQHRSGHAKPGLHEAAHQRAIRRIDQQVQQIGQRDWPGRRSTEISSRMPSITGVVAVARSLSNSSRADAGPAEHRFDQCRAGEHEAEHCSRSP